MTNHPTVYAEAARLYPDRGTGEPPHVVAQLRRAHIRGRTVTDGQIEAAAEAMHQHRIENGAQSLTPWEDLRPWLKDLVRDQARAALRGAGIIISDPIGMEDADGE